jgi:hypothetical protein
MSRTLLLAALVGLLACSKPTGTEPPAEGWANTGPTVVEQVVDRGTKQLLSVRQGPWQTWIEVPAVSAKVGDYVLLGKGTARHDVPIPEIGQTVSELVDIANVQVVDEATARQTLAASAPKGAVAVQTVYAELERRADQEIVVYGTVVKATSAVGSIWVHIQDGTGDAASGTHDLTIQTQQSVARGQRVAFRGVLHKDVDLGFGYHYDALVKEGVLIEPAR